MKLYELCAADHDVRFSPFVWRVIMCLLHKGIEFERIPLERLMIKETVKTDPKTVPVLEDDGRQIVDSFEIVKYLEENYPEKSLFLEEGALSGDELEKNKELNNWVNRTMVSLIFRMVVKDVNGIHNQENQIQFRKEKEPVIGQTFEEAHAMRDERRNEFRAAIAPLREHLADNDYLTGGEPAWFDYCVFGTLQWARIVSDFPMLAEDDVLASWMDRMLDLYDGYGRKAKLAY